MKLREIAKRFGTKSDEAIEAEIAKLREEKRALARRTGRFREDAVASAEALVLSARDQFAALVANVAPTGIPATIDNASVDRLLRLHLAGSSQFEEALLAGVEATPAAAFAEGTRVDYEAKLTEFDREIEQRRIELARRQKQAEVDLAEASLRALEEPGKEA